MAHKQMTMMRPRIQIGKDAYSLLTQRREIRDTTFLEAEAGKQIWEVEMGDGPCPYYQTTRSSSPLY